MPYGGLVKLGQEKSYNAYGEPVQTTDENGKIRTFAYDANFWPKQASPEECSPNAVAM